ncbi:hypothetical protein BT69DRAFT_1287095 [Atractiella rhizophila]|nr:hypothetical protein BT69DRAFT_1287095 [Atractiella rhizophila]
MFSLNHKPLSKLDNESDDLVTKSRRWSEGWRASIWMQHLYESPRIFEERYFLYSSRSPRKEAISVRELPVLCTAMVLFSCSVTCCRSSPVEI